MLHADMDAFYAAVEQRDCPALRGKPVIVGGSGRRAVVLTASYEARRFGVHSAMPGAQAQRLCPDGIFVRPRMARYAEVARQIRTVFGEFTPLVEPLSLDEAFLDVTGSLRLFHTAADLGQRLKERVRRVTGLTVSVGIGPSKMIAKIASGLCKPDGLLEVHPREVEPFLRPLPVQVLWGVGPVTQATLAQLGIETVGMLADRDPETLALRLGRLGRALWALAHGADSRAVEPDRERRSYGEEETFAQDQRDGATLRQTIMQQAESVAGRLRAAAHCGRTVTLKVKLARRITAGKYPVLTRRLTLPTPTDDGKLIGDSALALWDAVRTGTVVRLVGVSVSGITPTPPLQLGLFDTPPAQRRRALNQAIDALAARFGRGVVARGVIPAKQVGR